MKSPGEYDVIIVGAGAAGLMAMTTLLKTGHRVCLLEAAPVAGGRIATVTEKGFGGPVETGAEFIHGRLPLTLKLLKKANIAVESVGGRMVRATMSQQDDYQENDADWEAFMEALDKLKKDMPLQQLLDKKFSGDKYRGLRNSVKSYAEGYDLADLSRASAFFVRDEWSHEEGSQYRIIGGYSRLTDYLLDCCSGKNADLHFNAIVRSIEHDARRAIVHTEGSGSFMGRKVIVTVSAGVWQRGDIEFAPRLSTTREQAIRQLGFGTVTKILLQFRSSFWEDGYPDMGFLFTGAAIPTWWTQRPSADSLLTGWLSGWRKIGSHLHDPEALLQASLVSLSSAFQISRDALAGQLAHHKIIVWEDIPFIRGGYSYGTTESHKAKKVLSDPLSGTVYFAGEALSTVGPVGTVEAALQSGNKTAKMVQADLQA